MRERSYMHSYGSAHTESEISVRDGRLQSSKIVSRAGSAGSMISEDTRGGYEHLPIINVYNAPHLMCGTVMSIVKHSQFSIT